jgi:glycosyltransferase involved in cell wall biosynthesis
LSQALHLLLLTQHYGPETVGTARRAQLLAEFLVRLGWQVTVLCGQPNHPSMEGLFDPALQGRHLESGVDVIRLPVYRIGRQALGETARTSPLRRLPLTDRLTALPFPIALQRSHTYLSWMFHGLIHLPQLDFTPDCIVAISPLPTGLLGAIAASYHRVPLVFDLQDIWPDAAVRLGIVRQPGLIQGLEWLEQRVYAQAASLVVLSEGFRQQLEQRGLTLPPIEVLPNAVETGPFEGVTGETHRIRSGLSRDDILLMYAGNLGLAQDLDSLIDALVLLRSEPRLHVQLVGEGVEKARLQARIEGLGLPRVKFIPHQPTTAMPDILRAADLFFLSLRTDGFTPGTIPSKLYTYLAAGRPIINLVDGDPKTLLQRWDAGITISPVTPRSLADGIQVLLKDPTRRQRLGENGRRCVDQEASLERVGRAYAELLLRVSSPGSRR